MATTQIHGNKQIQINTVSNDRVLDLTLTNAKISASAGIELSKLAEAVIQADGGQAFTADQSLGGFKLTNLGTPTAAGDAATKGYVDSTATGLDVKQSARVASTQKLDDEASISGAPTYTNTAGTSGRGQITATLAVSGTFTIDGVTLANNNRILLKNEGDVGGLGGDANGLYFCTISGTVLTLDRTTDFDQDAEVTAGAFVFAEEGTVNSDNGYVLATNNPIVIGGASGTSLSFTQFSGAGQIVAGAGLTKTGNTLDVNTADTSMTINADSIQVKRDPAGAITLDGGSAGIEINHDGSTLTISANALKVADSGITGTQLNASVAGAGLAGGGGSALSVNTGNGTQITGDAVVLGPLTADWDQTGAFDIVLNNASSELKIRSSDGAAFYAILDAGVHGADATYTLSGGTGTLWTNANDGSGSGLDADLLDGLDSTAFLRATASSSLSTTFTLTVTSGAFVNFAVETGLKIGGTSLTTTITELNALGTIILRETPTGTVDGVNDTFTLASTPFSNTEEVFVNGLLQDPGAANDYTITGAVITFNAGAIPQTGSKVRVSYRA